MGGTPRPLRRTTRVLNQPIRIVLDTSTATAYTDNSPQAIAVGETLRELADENAAYAIPALCLADAALRLDPDRGKLLDVLAALPHARVLTLDANWRSLAAAADWHRGIPNGAARLAAIQLDAYLLTADPDAYGGRDADGIIAVD